MHDFGLIATLAGALSAALVLGYLTQRLGLSPIVGYLLAGILVGPHTPGFVADTALAEQLAEIGVILLMFGVGLQFHLEELLAVRRVAVPGAIIQSAVSTFSAWRSRTGRGGAGPPAWYSGSRSRSRARSCWFGCYPISDGFIRRLATSPSDGSWSRICSR